MNWGLVEPFVKSSIRNRQNKVYGETVVLMRHTILVVLW